MADLRKIIAEDGGTGKAVVFSQIKSTILHLSSVLGAEGILHVTIVRGDSQRHLTDAVTRFNKVTATPSSASASAAAPSSSVAPDLSPCNVFLLHASSAAAGLTLTAARHVLLVEPFLRAGEEAQALNRCHRIGQTRQVEAHIYYSRGTIEERLLLWRSRQPSSASASEDSDAPGGTRKGKRRLDEAQAEAAGGEENEENEDTAGDALAVLPQESVSSVSSMSVGFLRHLAGVEESRPEEEAARGGRRRGR